MFEFDEEDFNKEMLKMFNYKNDPNYDRNLDIKCNLKIQRKDLGKEKTLKYKENKDIRQIKIRIPKEIEEGQSIVCIKEGRQNNNKYGNLLLAIHIK